MKKTLSKKTVSKPLSEEYGGLIGGIAELLEAARRTAARTVNALMTATYWEIGRRIVEFEQQGAARAGYGEQILSKLSQDLTARFGRGFGRRNLFQIRAFYLAYRSIVQTSSAQLAKEQTLSAQSGAGVRATPLLESGGLDISESPSRKSPLMASHLGVLASAFPLPWSHYVRLLSVKGALAREFYHAEALRGGWSVRQLDRQIASQFYERTAVSRNKDVMLRKGAVASAEDSISADDEVRDPLVLEFLGLKDEYSETDLEEALLRHPMRS